MKTKWQYRSPPTDEGEQFVLSHTTTNHRTNCWHSFNFWHIKNGHKLLFTFRPNKTYNSRTKWTEKMCRALKDDLTSQTPSVKVIRFAIDDTLIFAGGGCINNTLPNIFEVYPEIKKSS